MRRRRSVKKNSEARERLRAVIAQAVEYLALRGGGPGRPPAEISAVNRYQRDLEAAYDDWADDAVRKLAAEKDDGKRDALLALLLGVLLTRLTDIARVDLPNAVAMGAGQINPTPDMYKKLAEIMAENEQYLENSLIPAIQAKLRNALMDPELRQSLYTGDASGLQTIRGWFQTFRSRIASYAGAWWRLYNWSVGMSIDDQRLTVTAYLDPQAHHCGECPLYHSEGGEFYDNFDQYLGATGGRVPGEFECDGNCRCWLEFGPPIEQITGRVGPGA